MKFVVASIIALSQCVSLTVAFGVTSSRQQVVSSTSLKSYENAPGATAPVGYWDPLNLTRDKEQELFDKARVGEVKNGRAAMLGVSGLFLFCCLCCCWE